MLSPGTGWSRCGEYGGALLREKIVARCAKRFLVMVDPSKVSEFLDKAVPVEVLPFAFGVACRHLVALGGRPRQRMATTGGGPYVTDNGNYVYDCRFPNGIEEPEAINAALESRAGVMESGLFLGMAKFALIAGDTSVRTLRKS